MANYKGKNDLYWNSEGDFALGENGDFQDTKNFAYRGFVQQVLTRMESNRGDWPLQREVGASLSDFLGRTNSRETADDIRNRVLSELSQSGLVAPADLRVDVVPISANTILILLYITPAGSRKSIYLTFSYNMAENKFVARNV